MRPRFAPLLVTVLLLSAPALAAVHIVAPDGSGDFPTIQAAVGAAAGGDEILLEDGTFTGLGNRDVDFLGKAITVRSQSGNRTACIVDCENAGAGFRFQSGEGPGSEVADLTVTRSADGAPAVDVRSTSPTLRNVVVTDAGSPAIFADFGAPLLTGCLLESNTAGSSYTQGVRLHLANATIEDCAFSGNDVQICVKAHGGTTTVRRCEFLSNTVQAVSAVPGPLGEVVQLTLEDCTLDGNYDAISMDGAGASSLVVRNCVIRNHDGYAGGGGIGLSGTLTATVEDCEIRSNTGVGVSGVGGGVTLTMERCTVDGNGSNGVQLTKVGVAGPYAEIRDCTFTGNRNGLFVNGSALIESCRLQGNERHGVVAPGAASITVRDCLVTGHDDVGLWFGNCPAVLVESCTVVSNRANGGGGGIQAAGSSVQVLRTILWGNCSVLDGWQVGAEQGASVQISCSNVDSALLGVHAVTGGTYTLANLLELDPQLCSPADCLSAPTTGGIYGLDPASPALSQACGTMGATQPSCTAVGVEASLTDASWGRVKAGYRR